MDRRFRFPRENIRDQKYNPHKNDKIIKHLNFILFLRQGGQYFRRKTKIFTFLCLEKIWLSPACNWNYVNTQNNGLKYRSRVLPEIWCRWNTLEYVVYLCWTSIPWKIKYSYKELEFSRWRESSQITRKWKNNKFIDRNYWHRSTHFFYILTLPFLEGSTIPEIFPRIRFTEKNSELQIISSTGRRWQLQTKKYQERVLMRALFLIEIDYNHRIVLKNISKIT